MKKGPTPRYKSPTAGSLEKGTVSNKVISGIKKAGMAASLKKAATSNDKTFLKGVARMYGNERLANARNVNKVFAPIGQAKSNFTYGAGNMPDPKRKTKATPKGNIAGFKPGTPGAKAAGAIKSMGKDLKKAYQGK
jgi:hypothetical protein